MESKKWYTWNTCELDILLICLSIVKFFFLFFCLNNTKNTIKYKRRKKRNQNIFCYVIVFLFWKIFYGSIFFPFLVIKRFFFLLFFFLISLDSKLMDFAWENIMTISFQVKTCRKRDILDVSQSMHFIRFPLTCLSIIIIEKQWHIYRIHMTIIIMNEFTFDNRNFKMNRIVQSMKFKWSLEKCM